MDLQTRYPTCMVDVDHVYFPWLFRHVGWLAARFQVRTTDKTAAYRIVFGVDYQSPMCVFWWNRDGKTAKLSNKSAETLGERSLGRPAGARQHQYHPHRGWCLDCAVRPPFATGSPNPGCTCGDEGCGKRRPSAAKWLFSRHRRAETTSTSECTRKTGRGSHPSWPTTPQPIGLTERPCRLEPQ